MVKGGRVMKTCDTITIPPNIDVTLHEKAEELEREQRYRRAWMVRNGWVLLDTLGRLPRTRRNAA